MSIQQWYSDEDYSDDYHSPRKRRRLKHVPDDYIIEQRGFFSERSSRQSEMHISSLKGSGHRYNESEIEMGISHKSKKIERYRADRLYSPKSYNRRGDKVQRVSRSNMPDEAHHFIRAKKKLKGYNTETHDTTARPRQTKAKQMQSKQYLRSNLEKTSPVDSSVSYELPTGYSCKEEEEVSPPQTTNLVANLVSVMKPLLIHFHVQALELLQCIIGT